MVEAVDRTSGAHLRVIALALAGAGTLVACTGSPSTPIVVNGSVRLGPSCPVERVDSPCPVPPGAFAGAQVVAGDGGREVRAPVSADGRFVVRLEAGTWQLTATAGMSCSTVTVTASATVVIDCDTGIR
jgi:hypothetical protein